MSNPTKKWFLPAVVIATGLTAVAAIGLLTSKNARHSAGIQSSSAAEAHSAIDSNPDVDPGTSAGDTAAPDFHLVDQTGRETSLTQFRGKVVLMAFVDSQCTTICPLTTESMLKALRILGTEAADVQLLGVNANPLALKVSDVAAYTRAHGMQGHWRFLTGSLPQLTKVWRDYNVYVSAINNDIDHQPAMVLVDPLGRERTVYLTQMSYEGVAPQAQVLADDIAKLLPGSSVATKEVSLKYVAPLQPAAAVKLTTVGEHKQTIAIGGPHAHLVLFFASWVGEDANVASHLADLDRYSALARRDDWPSPLAVDESTTESSAAAVEKKLAQLASRIHTPLIKDTNGRLGDGYHVQDLPWYSLSSSDGKIIWSHDGWLSSSALERQIRAAVAKAAQERTTALAKSHSSSATEMHAKSSAAE